MVDNSWVSSEEAVASPHVKAHPKVFIGWSADASLTKIGLLSHFWHWLSLVCLYQPFQTCHKSFSSLLTICKSSRIKLSQHWKKLYLCKASALIASKGWFSMHLNSHMVIRCNNSAMFKEICLSCIKVSLRIEFWYYFKNIFIRGKVKKLCKF